MDRIHFPTYAVHGFIFVHKKTPRVQGLYERIGERTATTKAEVREKIDFIIVFDPTD